MLDSDFPELSPSRTAMDDAAEGIDQLSRSAEDIRSEVSGWSAVAGERHAEIISHLNWTIDGKLGSVVQLLDTIRWLLFGVIALLVVIAYHLK